MKNFLNLSEGLSLEELMGVKGGNNGVVTCQAGSVGSSTTVPPKEGDRDNPAKHL